MYPLYSVRYQCSFLKPHLLKLTYYFTAVFDAVPLYPVNIVPAPLLTAQELYKKLFNDQLVATQPPWFHFFTLVEFIYQLPVVLWAIWALSTKSPKAPTHLLVWALVCFITTLTCIYEFYENQVMTETQKTRVIGGYGLYAVICMFLSPPTDFI